MTTLYGYAFSSDQPYVVPPGVTSISVTACGASGGRAAEYTRRISNGTSFPAFGGGSPATLVSYTPTYAPRTGDMLLAVVIVIDTYATVATPAGWTHMNTKLLHGGLATNISQYIFIRVADGTSADFVPFVLPVEYNIYSDWRVFFEVIRGNGIGSAGVTGLVDGDISTPVGTSSPVLTLPSTPPAGSGFGYQIAAAICGTLGPNRAVPGMTNLNQTDTAGHTYGSSFDMPIMGARLGVGDVPYALDWNLWYGSSTYDDLYAVSFILGDGYDTSPTYGTPGKGGRVTCDIPVTPGETLIVRVGGEGGETDGDNAGSAGGSFGGGGAALGAGGGGGYSGIFRGSTPLMIAPGGGGVGKYAGVSGGGNGGDGGMAGLNGQAGTNASYHGLGGAHGTSGAGGTGGTSIAGTNGTSGSSLSGGSGGFLGDYSGGNGGGGGGGFYGGGGGGAGRGSYRTSMATAIGDGTGGSGGGGGGYGLTTGINASSATGAWSGNGFVQITDGPSRLFWGVNQIVSSG